MNAVKRAHEERAAESEQKSASIPRYYTAIGYLRAFLTVLVVAHHAVLAYHPFAPPPARSLLDQPQWWRAFPIVDKERSTGFSLLVGFNDVFFMSLMFFLSGLFVWQSLQHKGSGTFVRDRMLRLGVPFLAGAALSPLAYYPAYLATGADPSLASFSRVWLSQPDWASGPVWFVWVLLAFDCAAAALFLAAPRAGEAVGRLASNAMGRPAAFFGLLVAVSAAAYVPMALVFSPLAWTTFGPFAFQTSRLLHYVVYFVAGIAVGAWGIERGLLSEAGKLAWRWPRWVAAMIGWFVVASIVGIIAVTTGLGSPVWATLGALGFVLSCAASSFGLMAVFARFARTRSPILDSLRDNAYGIYLVHYGFVIWLQYAVLGASLPAIVKGSIVFFGALALSWGTAVLLRRVPGVARVI